MTDHDPCCPSTGMAMPFGYVPVFPCQCGFIANVRADQDEKSRADERERIRLRVTELYENADLSSRAYEYIINIIEGK